MKYIYSFVVIDGVLSTYIVVRHTLLSLLIKSRKNFAGINIIRMIQM